MQRILSVHYVIKDQKQKYSCLPVLPKVMHFFCYGPPKIWASVSFLQKSDNFSGLYLANRLEFAFTFWGKVVALVIKYKSCKHIKSKKLQLQGQSRKKLKKNRFFTFFPLFMSIGSKPLKIQGNSQLQKCT